MKLKPSLVLLSIALALAGFARAQNTAAPEPASREAEMEVPYIGVASVPIPPPLTAQLKLPPGFGLLVTWVVKNSPATEAGLAENDVLVKLDDQQLIDPNQLAVLVRSHKPDDEITLSLIRGGETKAVKVKIGKHAVSQAALNHDGNRKFVAFGPEFRGAVGPMGLMPEELGAGRAIVIRGGDKRFELRTGSGEDLFLVVGDDGKELFRGEAGTPEQREKIPKEFREYLEKMDKIHLQPPAFDHAFPGSPGAGTAPADLRAGVFQPDLS